MAAGLVVAAATFTVLALTGEDEADPPPPETPPTAGQGAELFARMGCGSCHTLAAAGSSGVIGPDLDGRLDSYDAASLEAVILDPPAPPGGGFSPMPDDFGRRMTAAELDALVAFLLEAGSSPPG